MARHTIDTVPVFAASAMQTPDETCDLPDTFAVIVESVTPRQAEIRLQRADVTSFWGQNLDFVWIAMAPPTQSAGTTSTTD